MRDLISRVMAAFAVMLLALAHPRTAEAITAALTATTAPARPETPPPATPEPTPPRPGTERVRPYATALASRAPYAFGSPQWWDAHAATKRPQTFIHDGPPYRPYLNR
ncbi:hypothetical protein ACQEU5_03485 [Marinactinospora thermotolerans]|uniref:hypothetical protein n=1 Tax=Marinactinospora thermotolerans TaxID=531310 RepID=UPI003D8A31CE